MFVRRLRALTVVAALVAAQLTAVPSAAATVEVVARLSDDRVVEPVAHDVDGQRYAIWTFDTGGVFRITTDTLVTIDHLVVGGGGAGGSDAQGGGGGGGGGVVTSVLGAAPIVVEGEVELAIEVGKGGLARGGDGDQGGDGAPSRLSGPGVALEADGGGGGGGGSSDTRTPGRPGAAGGGGAGNSGGPGSPGGFGRTGGDGASGRDEDWIGGGGGGAGGPAADDHGGPGLDVSEWLGRVGGDAGRVGGGGAGAGGDGDTLGRGGVGGGADAPGWDVAEGIDGRDATGGGGSGGDYYGNTGGAGGSGLVALRIAVDELTYDPWAPAPGPFDDLGFDVLASLDGGGEVAPTIHAAGGSDYAVFTFTQDGTFAVTGDRALVDYVVVGGGGGGGSSWFGGGGGGAGAVITSFDEGHESVVLDGGDVVEVLVGAGGSGAPPGDGEADGLAGENGGPSRFGDVVAGGGGGGGGDRAHKNGGDGTLGASGGGGGAHDGWWGEGDAPGHRGADGYTNLGGGGGGAGGPGGGEWRGDADARPGPGRDLRTVIGPRGGAGGWFGGGGAGGGSAARDGGVGGGGGADEWDAGSHGVANTGGGGGGNGFGMTAGGDGGSGVVVVRVLLAGVDGPKAAGLDADMPTTATNRVALDPQPSVRLLDADGDPLARAGVQITARLLTANATLSSAEATTDATGEATFVDLTISGSVGSHQIVFETGSPAVSSEPVTVELTAGPVSGLHLDESPVLASAGEPLAPQPRLSARDADGNLVNDAMGNVTASVSGAGCALVGAATADVAAGTAVFADLGIGGEAGSTCRLTFDLEDSEHAASIDVTLTAGAPHGLVLVEQPTGARARQALRPAPTVALTDAHGNRVESAATVSVELVGPTTVMLSGEREVVADSGVATFPDLALAGPAGTEVTLRFSAEGLVPLESAAFPLHHGEVAQLDLDVAPAGVPRGGGVLTQQPELGLVDADGNLVTDAEHDVDVYLVGDGDELLASVRSVAGRAVFPDLEVTGDPGATRTLRFRVAGTAIVADADVTLPRLTASPPLLAPPRPPTDAPLAPVPDPGHGALPRLWPGAGQAVVDGATASVDIETTGSGVRVTTADLHVMATPVAAERGSQTDKPVDGAVLRVPAGGQLEVVGGGFAPRTRVAVWLFSQPTLLGEVLVDDEGAVAGELSLLPAGVRACDHTLQLVGMRADGRPVAISLGIQVVPEASPFPDVDPAGAHAEAIACGAELGLLAGRADGTFAPATTLTRGQAASLLSRFAGLATRPAGDGGGREGFTDLVGGPHDEAVTALAAAGVAQGRADGTFRPDEPVSRGQLASMLARVLGVEPRTRPYRDLAGTVHAGAIESLTDLGVLNGYADGSFEPTRPVTRAQAAAMVVRGTRVGR